MISRNILHYKIIEELGSGGVGIVYKAEDTKLGRTVAIKCLRNLLTVGSEQRKRFEQEARAAASLNHPGIATIYGLEEVDGQLFIVMEFVDGQNLRRLIGNKPGRPYTPTLPLEKILNYTVKIAEGLKTAHEKGIVHRDIKPENIMINSRGEMKIMDFGLAKMTGS
jgi:serine/threonine protein kinase